MILRTDDPRRTGNLLELADPKSRAELATSHEILASAARVRERTWQFEDPIREWENRVRAEAPRGRRWRAALSECVEMVARARDHHLEVRGLEAAALPHLRSAIECLSTGVGAAPSRSIDLLAGCAGLRADSLDHLERVVDLSGRISRMGARTALPELLPLLDERRRLLGEVAACGGEADQLLHRAIALRGEPPPALEEAAELAIQESDEPFDNAPVWAARDAEADLEARDWDSWIESLNEELSTSAVSKDADGELQALEEDYTWSRAVRDVVEGETGAPAAATDPDAELEEEAPELDALHVALAERIDTLSGELAVVRQVAARAVRELEEEINALTEDRVEATRIRAKREAMERFVKAYHELEEE